VVPWFGLLQLWLLLLASALVGLGCTPLTLTLRNTIAQQQAY
jgi:hypothetical protein